MRALIFLGFMLHIRTTVGCLGLFSDWIPELSQEEIAADVNVGPTSQNVSSLFGLLTGVHPPFCLQKGF